MGGAASLVQTQSMNNEKGPFSASASTVTSSAAESASVVPMSSTKACASPAKGSSGLQVLLRWATSQRDDISKSSCCSLDMQVKSSQKPVAPLVNIQDHQLNALQDEDWFEQLAEGLQGQRVELIMQVPGCDKLGLLTEAFVMNADMIEACSEMISFKSCSFRPDETCQDVVPGALCSIVSDAAYARELEHTLAEIQRSSFVFKQHIFASRVALDRRKEERFRQIIDLENSGQPSQPAPSPNKIEEHGKEKCYSSSEAVRANCIPNSLGPIWCKTVQLHHSQPTRCLTEEVSIEGRNDEGTKLARTI